MLLEDSSGDSIEGSFPEDFLGSCGSGQHFSMFHLVGSQEFELVKDVKWHGANDLCVELSSTLYPNYLLIHSNIC